MTTKTKITFAKGNLKVDLSTIENPLSKKKSELVNKSLKDLSDELLADPDFMKAINFYKANNITFDPNIIPKGVMKPLKAILVPEEVQRLLDHAHCTNTVLAKFDRRLLSPAYVVCLMGSTELLLFDSMHTVTVMSAMARCGLWEGYDESNWMDMEYPCWIIETDEESFAARAALYRNGEGSKPWEPYDYHRVYVRSFSLYNDAGPRDKYALAAKKQKICEREFAIPLPKKHQQQGMAGTTSRVEDIAGYDESDLDEFEFIMKTNNKYWHGTALDSAAFGFYGNLYKGLNLAGVPLKGKEYDQFMNDIHAIIKTFFVSMGQLRIVTSATYKTWMELQNRRGGSPADNCALAIVSKIYKRLGGTHPVTSDATAYVYAPTPTARHDIYDSLPLSMRQKIANSTL
jgi:hypothetical protein